MRQVSMHVMTANNDYTVLSGDAFKNNSSVMLIGFSVGNVIKLK